MTQSVHKQQAGFSQTSQIHKKDNHIRGQARFCPHKRLKMPLCSMLLPARSTRCLPRWTLMPKFMKGRVGVGCGLSALSWVLSRARLFLRAVTVRPFIPPVVDGKLWQDYPTSVLASDRRFFQF